MDKEVKSLKENLLKMCWYMRGGVTYTEIVNMGSQEREAIPRGTRQKTAIGAAKNSTCARKGGRSQ